MDRFSKRGDDLISDRDALWGVLEDVLGDAKSGQLYFILDGLDECDAESQHFLLVKLTSLFLSTSVAAQDISIKLIMTSRPSTDMDILFAETSPAILDISIHSGMVNADLTAYIDQKVDVIAREKSYPEDLAKETKAALRRGAEGTFLWASLVIQDLRRAALFEVEGILGNLPKGLYGVYD
ncbi:Pfs, NACHT, and Ankyrin domain protein [Beauveria bassiana ARSEF 2860]|uniref:Pfs, NACHT, and Ankyrin domain protein n=1 Tax=Beauveria bassiana (strain ARSEF 2860) TaxID=655819 RepID=J4KM33_BEAB2|nr:Pfs, NACHT, and Ankyrin domain protein [Beauveria bassiana ARSEF 2860]EJP63254.1 Pfs, NACHT, and Ankyrin domain protein [Beauveria bassiana ARSEF 2860]